MVDIGDFAWQSVAVRGIGRMGVIIGRTVAVNWMGVAVGEIFVVVGMGGWVLSAG